MIAFLIAFFCLKNIIMTTVTEEIDKFIKDNGGCTRDALNVALFTIETLRIEIELFKLQIKRIESHTPTTKKQ